jgi:hypothetical protein
MSEAAFPARGMKALDLMESIMKESVRRYNLVDKPNFSAITFFFSVNSLFCFDILSFQKYIYIFIMGQNS